MRLLGAAFLSLGFIGCNPPPRPLLSEIGVTDENQLAEKESLAPSQPGVAHSDAVSFRSIELPWESWHVYFVGGRKVGYIHLKSEIDPEGNDKNVHTSVEERMLLPRGTSSIVQVLNQKNIETRDGNCLSFESDLQVGPSTLKSAGRVNVDELIVNTERGGQRVSTTAPWAERVGGAAAIAQTLLAKPMTLKEERRVRLLVPIQNRMATAELKCLHRASIANYSGQVHDTVEIEAMVGQEDEESTLTTLWIDAKGQLVKSHIASSDLIAIRSTRQEAEKIWDSLEGVSYLASISATGSLSNPSKAHRVGYLLKPKSDVNSANFGIQPQIGQYFRKREDGAVQLLVSRDPADANRPEFTGLVSTPIPEDLASSPIVDSDSASVRELANLSKATDKRILAQDLVRTAKQMVVPTNESPLIVPASQTAKDSGGSAGSRAALLAAMLRARGIPARLVAGLLYHEANGKAAMIYHVWTIASIDGQWLALDPTLGEFAPADRIAISTSSLANTDPHAFLSPVVTAVAQMDIEIGNAKYNHSSNE
jgi:transglutaminase-like putative cysteine protease